MTACGVALLVATLVAGDDPGKLVVKAERLDPPAGLAEPVRKALDPGAFTVTGADGAVVLTVWFRTVMPAKATAEQVRNGLTYREIPEGTLLGAVRFPEPFVDYRKQTIPAGVYTLRFAVQPDVGDHLGTTPHPEFALLCPAEKDADPEQLEPKALHKLSAATTGGDHPGVMLLFPHAGKGAGPRVADRDGGVKILLTRRAVEADGVKAELGFALTVAGHSKAR